MSGKRVPAMLDLASLSRDEWEALAHDICAVIYDTERVEDRLGRGNGLDALRQEAPGGPVEGWQFRRFDDRLEDKQVVKLQEAVARAVAACKSSLGGPLKSFTVFGNIDLQPGHGKLKGEDARFSDFRIWCQNTHGVEATYRGVTWVRARLLKYPHLKPALFEDVPAAIESAKQEILAAVQGQAAMQNALEKAKAQSEGLLAVLVAEATRHLERGQELGSQEEFLLAVRSLRDAERLAKAPGIPLGLLARIQAALSSTLYVTGSLTDSVTAGRAALVGASELGDLPLLRFTIGSLALALSDAQEYQEARQLFLRVLRMGEEAADLVDIVHSITGLLSVYTRLNDWGRAEGLSRRLESKVQELDERIGPSQAGFNALGNIANFLLSSALDLPEPLRSLQIQRAAGMFESMTNRCRALKLERTAVLADASLARALWFLSRYDESYVAFERAVKSAGDKFAKAAADCRYNQAMMLAQAGRRERALEAAQDSLYRYDKIGDTASSADAANLLNVIRGQARRPTPRRRR